MLILTITQSCLCCHDFGVLIVSCSFLARAPASRPPVGGRAAGGGGAGTANLNAQIEELNTQLMESKLTIEGLEKERDFYFGKLRDIEVLAQEHESDGNEFVQKALGILYATEVRHDTYAADMNMCQPICFS